MQSPDASFNGNQPEEEVLLQSPETIAEPQPLVEEFVPKFTHTQEDLRYMFGIEVNNESDLSSPIIKKQMYTKAVSDFITGNPFSLEYFLEEELLSPKDILKEDIPSLKQAATSMLASLRHLTRRIRSQELFVEAGILTQEEIDTLSKEL